MSIDVALRTNDDRKRLVLRDIRTAEHPDYLCANISARSNGFGCDHTFYFDRFSVERLFTALEAMIAGGIVEYVLAQEYEIDHLTFRNDKMGHVFVSGSINEHGSGHHLSFTMATDQTALQPFLDDFREAIHLVSPT